MRRQRARLNPPSTRRPSRLQPGADSNFGMGAGSDSGGWGVGAGAVGVGAVGVGVGVRAGMGAVASPAFSCAFGGALPPTPAFSPPPVPSAAPPPALGAAPATTPPMTPTKPSLADDLLAKSLQGLMSR